MSMEELFSVKASCGKARIKHEVFWPELAVGVAHAVKKSAARSKTSLMPPVDPSDQQQLLSNVTHVVEDSNIRMHSFVNTFRDASSPTGYTVSGVDGTALASYVMSTARNAFQWHPRCRIFVACNDKGLFMPPPKKYTQAERTKTLADTLERKQIRPIVLVRGEPVPQFVAAGHMLPPWDAIRANREVYRHATDQVLKLIEETYRPPPGKVVIFDALDMAATGAAESIDSWMVSDRLLLSDRARDVIERTRVALRGAENWRKEASKIAYELAQHGHIKSIPVCIETSDDGTTYAPFLLHNAANDCGEADVGVHFWLRALQADRQHITLAGNRLEAQPLDPQLAHYYDDDDLEEHASIAASVVATQPLSVEERRIAAQRELDANPDILVDAAQNGSQPPISVTEALPLNASNRCKKPNRGLVISTDTDFLSLTTLYYAELKRDNEFAPQYCVDNAPLVCLGECRLTAMPPGGWIDKYERYWIRPTAAEKRKRDKEGGEPLLEEADTTLVYDVWDIERLLEKVVECCGAKNAVAVKRYDVALSFAAFCAAAENDYLAGLVRINRSYQWKAFCEMMATRNTAPLAAMHQGHGPLINTERYINYLKRCYWNYLSGARGTANKPGAPADSISLNQIAIVQRKKHKATEAAHTPSGLRLELMYMRLQWWLWYATYASQSISLMLDENVWGWRTGTTHVKV